MPEYFDVVILGSGQGGKQLAWHLGRSGKKLAVIERRWVGGSCPAVACLPSKNELWSARVGMPYTKMRDAVIAHLTVAEGLGPLLANVQARTSDQKVTSAVAAS